MGTTVELGAWVPTCLRVALRHRQVGYEGVVVGASLYCCCCHLRGFHLTKSRTHRLARTCGLRLGDGETRGHGGSPSPRLPVPLSPRLLVAAGDCCYRQGKLCELDRLSEM